MCIEILIDNNIQNSLASAVVYAYNSCESVIDDVCLRPFSETSSSRNLQRQVQQNYRKIKRG